MGVCRSSSQLFCGGLDYDCLTFAELSSLAVRNTILNEGFRSIQV